MAEAAFPPALLDALERDAVHVGDVRKALDELSSPASTPARRRAR